MNSVDRALTKSQQAFIEYVEPLIRQKLQPEYLHRCEGHKHGLEAKLDRDYCVDYIIFKGGRMHGLASRISFRRQAMHEMTLRKTRINPETGEEKPSEYFKYKAAIKSGGAYPEYFCTACFDNDELLTCTFGLVADLIAFIDETTPPLKRNDSDKYQWQDYFVVDLRDMKKRGYKLWTLKAA